MTPQTCKKLLEMGILQAYAEGKTIEVYDSHSNTWYPYNEPNDHPWFDRSPNHYRIKPEPQFEVGDLVRTDSNHHVAKIESIGYNNIEGTVLYLNTGGWLVVNKCNIIKVHEIRTPFTFEEAVKACAEHGMEVKCSDNRGIINAIDYNSIRVGSEYLYFSRSCLQTVFTSDNTPFCNISYEPIPTN